MDNSVSGKQFSSLLDAVAADDVGLRPSTAGDGTGPDTSGLGPSVGDDSPAATSPSLTMLGPSVGDDSAPTSPSVTMLGPSVGDDSQAATSPNVTMLGPSVGDDRAPSPSGETMLGPSVADDSSDLRLKEDVRCIGTTVFGLPLYQFKYIGAPETYEGVMAQDVLQVMPSAVSRGADGYYRVNYGALGTSMRRVS
jgi:hypothetical protein